tara:strand:+ start:259 stop:1104 length:846 start_codon:yes stop_codon:yes gene_type:complete
MEDVNWEIPLAAYLDEAGEEPLSSCQNLKEHGIHYAFLRHIWSGNVVNLSDNSHAKLKKILLDEQISVIGIASDLGKAPANKLADISDETINNTANICKYYNASMVRVFIGEHDNYFTAEDIDNWLVRIQSIFLSHGIQPLIEITPDACLTASSKIAELLNKHKGCKLLYDPVNFILKRNTDPFIKHWTLLKNFTAAIDIRDIKIGKGFKPPGMGDSKIANTIKDSIETISTIPASHFKSGGPCLWYILEPSLGRRHGQGRTKKDTFGFAVEGLKIILNQI